MSIKKIDIYEPMRWRDPRADEILRGEMAKFVEIVPPKSSGHVMTPHPLHVTVKFGSDIPASVQGKALLDFEKALRALCPDQWIEVFKEAKGDDSKLRSAMTKEQRANL